MRKNVYNCFFGTWGDVTKRANFNSMVSGIPFSILQVIDEVLIIFFTLFSNSGILEGRFRIGWDCQFEYLNFSGTMYHDNI